MPAAPPVPATGTANSNADAAANGSAQPAQTPQERRAALERRLDASLGGFDRDLSSERERVAKERDARAAAAGSAVTEGAADSANGSAGAAAGAKSPGGRPGDLHSERSAREEQGKQSDGKGGDAKGADGKGGTANGNGAAGRNIPDGSDDDIVARRLRKAAEAETDPELKERLWQEYIEYKRSGQNKG